MPVTACELLYERVLPFYDALGVPVQAILTYNLERSHQGYLLSGRTPAQAYARHSGVRSHHRYWTMLPPSTYRRPPTLNSPPYRFSLEDPTVGEILDLYKPGILPDLSQQRAAAEVRGFQEVAQAYLGFPLLLLVFCRHCRAEYASLLN